jgi:integrase
MEFIGMNADKILELRLQDSTSTNQQIRHRFESLLKEFLADAKKNREYENGTLQSIYAAIRSFFEAHYYPLQMRKKDYPKSTANGVRRATRKAILELLAENNTSLTAKILTANDTGLGASDIVKLNCNIILDNPNKDFIMIIGKRTKTGDIYKTFLGEESIQALKDYIKLRQKGTRKTKPETITKDSPLFVLNNGKKRLGSGSCVGDKQQNPQ